ncbi:YdaS family helix-turn-helix protein [Sphingobium sp.]|uniref:YdaS family helix-turn-helix protein n=1 Tax=Sphingobium sp. TaxID=1912891 RepID=UPI0028BD5A1F|nr:YdaS family helix-turn-helix protein [Sphingobium sp.]
MDTKPTRFEALKLVIEAYGTQEAAAAAFRVSQSSISRWLSQSKQLPAEHVIQAETDTGISRHWIRPDIYPVEDAASRLREHAVDQFADLRFVGTDRRAGNGNRPIFLDTLRASR